MNSPRKARVLLSDDRRRDLERVARDGATPARKARLARLLLHADEAHPEGRRSDAWIAAALGMHANTVAAARKRFAAAGEAALDRKARDAPPVPPKVDGRVEAHLVALCCSAPPEGRARWTLRLLADALVSRKLVAEVSIETVRKALKKTSCGPGGSSGGASPSATRPGSSPRWRRSSTPTRPGARPTGR